MASNQDQQQQQQQQHLVYQQAYATSYQAANPINAWNQPPQQAVAFAVPFHTDVGSYAEKASYGGYPPLAYTNENELLARTQTANYAAAQYTAAQMPQAAQWQQYQQQPTYTNFAGYVAPTAETYTHTAPLPTINHQPQVVKRDADSFQIIPIADISMLENPEQSAAAYTASWVSSTSSIPPELRDEPEEDMLQNAMLQNMLQNDMGTWDARTAAWPGLNEEARKPDSKTQRKREEALRRREEAPREMTWDERLQKARQQKDRAEMRGFELPVNGGNNAGNRGDGRGRGRRDAGDKRGNHEGKRNNRDWKEGGEGPGKPHGSGGNFSRPDEDRQQRGAPGNVAGNATSGTNATIQAPNPNVIPFNPSPVTLAPGAQWIGPPSSMGNPLFVPNYRRGGGTSFVRRDAGAQMVPFFVPNLQDQKFRNTWLDVQTYTPFVPVTAGPVPFPVDGRFNQRGGGFGGRGGRGGFRNGQGRGSAFKPYRRDTDEEEPNTPQAMDELVDRVNQVDIARADPEASEVEGESTPEPAPEDPSTPTQ